MLHVVKNVIALTKAVKSKNKYMQNILRNIIEQLKFLILLKKLILKNFEIK